MATHPITHDHDDQPITAIPSLSPLDVWTAMKTVLRRELGEREWEMWIQHARLWRVMSGDTLGVLVPRNGKASFGLLRHIRRLRNLAGRMGYGVIVSVEYDMDFHQMKREAILEMDRGEDFPATHRHAQQLLEKWEQEHEWLTCPFLEPACSPLWEVRR